VTSAGWQQSSRSTLSISDWVFVFCSLKFQAAQIQGVKVRGRIGTNKDDWVLLVT
jgi:hypothetical protein